MHIVSDLLSYCHLNGAKEFHLDINTEQTFSLFTLKAKPVVLSGESLEQLRINLNAPRQQEIEQVYVFYSVEISNRRAVHG